MSSFLMHCYSPGEAQAPAPIENQSLAYPINVFVSRIFKMTKGQINSFIVKVVQNFLAHGYLKKMELSNDYSFA